MMHGKAAPRTGAAFFSWTGVLGVIGIEVGDHAEDSGSVTGSPVVAALRPGAARPASRRATGMRKGEQET